MFQSKPLTTIPVLAVVRRVWSQLVEPPAGLPAAERRSARLLSHFLIAVVALGAAYELAYVLFGPGSSILEIVEAVVSLVTLGVAYGLSRAGRIRLSVTLTITTMTLGIFAVTATTSQYSHDVGMLVFLVLPLLIGNIFYSGREVLLMVGLQSIGMLGLTALTPRLSMMDIAVGPLPFLWLTTCIIIISKRNRDRQERDRQTELAESERRFRRYFELGLVGMAITSPTKGILEANDHLCSILGYEREELLQRTWAELTHPDDRAADVAQFNRTMAGDIDSYSMDKRWIRKDGGVVHSTISVSCLRRADGSVDYFEALLQDITERKRAEAALAENEQRFRALTERAPDGVAIYGPSGGIVYASPATGRILGYAPEEITGAEPVQITHPDDLPGLLTILNELIASPDNVVTTQYRMRRKDGSWCWLESTISNCLAVPGIDGLVFNFRDITEQHHDQDQIRLQLQRLRTLHTIDRAISNTFDVQVCLASILDETVTQLGVSAVAVLLFNEPMLQLEYVAGKGFGSSTIANTRLRIGEGFAGRAALERRAVRIAGPAQAGQQGVNDPVRAALLAEEAFASYHALPLIAKGALKGVLEVFHRAELRPDREWLAFLETLAGQTAIAIDNGQLFRRLQRSNLEMRLAYDATIEGWSRGMELRDMATEGHNQRVTELTLRLACATGMTETELEHVRRGALLHDMGKMGVPDAILLKPGPLTEQEWAVMRNHPQYAHDMLAPIAYLRPALDIPYCHHEKWDGTGYPRGLKELEIPLAARLFAVADVWDALLSDRPYRAGWPKDRIADYLREQSGRHFDPQVVVLFLQSVS